MATTKFLVQILKGHKKAFHYYEVDCVSVPHNRYTSKKVFTKLIKKHEELQQFSPTIPPPSATASSSWTSSTPWTRTSLEG